MRLFKKAKKEREHGTLTDHIADYLEKRQHRLADWLNQKTNGVSKKLVLYGLIVFCAIAISYLLYIMLTAFS